MLWKLLDTIILEKTLTGLPKPLSELIGEIMDKCMLENLVKDKEFVDSNLELDSLVLLMLLLLNDLIFFYQV